MEEPGGANYDSTGRMLKFVSRRTNVEPILEIMLAAWMSIEIR
jgi:hypothetical protein